MAQADSQKKPLRLKEWMTGNNCSLQIKWHNTLKNGWLPAVFWNILSLQKFNALNRSC